MIDALKCETFDTRIQNNYKPTILKSLYLDNYKTAARISSSYDEEWKYEASTGLLSNTFLSLDQKKMFKFDGTFLRSLSQNDGLGFGRWDGFTISWFSDSQKVIDEYIFYPPENEFVCANEELSWVWHPEKNSLQAKFGGNGWIVEGTIPFCVVMFLQLIRYASLTVDLDDL